MFELAGKIALREIARNKIRLIVGCLISLILFLSAFILINLSYSLPVNFYKYYEEFFPSDLLIEVNNADKAFFDSASNYFVSVAVADEFIKDKFELRNGNKYFSYSAQGAESDNPNVIHKYKSEFAEAAPLDELFKSGKIDAEKFLISGSLWDGESGLSSIWLSDKAADELGISEVGENISLGLDVKENGAFVYDEYTVEGIYAYDEYLNFSPNPPVFLMTRARADEIYFREHSVYRVVGRVGDVSKLYGIYNNLSKKYDLGDSVQVDMLIAVKNAEAICAIIGVCMLVGGLIVLMNFISMFISTNRKGIGLMTALGARSASVSIGYGLIFAFMLFVIGLITLIIIPSVNSLISAFIFYIGYHFEITTNYWLLLGLYAVSNVGMILIMVYENERIKRMTPLHELKEED